MGLKLILTGTIPLFMNLPLNAFFWRCTRPWAHHSSFWHFLISLEGALLKPAAHLSSITVKVPSWVVLGRDRWWSEVRGGRKNTRESSMTYPPPWRKVWVETCCLIDFCLSDVEKTQLVMQKSRGFNFSTATSFWVTLSQNFCFYLWTSVLLWMLARGVIGSR